MGRRLIGIAAALLAVGCEGPVDPAIELGGGEVEYEPLADGDEVFVILGPQGGFHVLGSVVMKGIEAGNPDLAADPINPTTTFSVLHEGDELVIIEPFTQGYDPIVGELEGGWTDGVIGRFVILDIDSDDELDGEEIRLTATVTDHEGTTWTDSRTLTTVPHPLND